ncbi:MAG: YncE family protein [Ramlibacter sp.]
MTKISGALLFALAALLAGCGGGSSGSSTPRAQATLANLLPVTGAGLTTNLAFDLGTVVGNRYYFTDRTNAAVDVYDTTTDQQVAQIKGSGANAFAGQTADNSTSGPNGINAVGNLLYVGDVNSVKIIDPTTQSVVKTIQVGTQNVRADEACVDPVHNLYMIATPEASTPYVSIINTQTQSLVANVTFTDPAGNPSAGLEGCEYDAATDSFYINDDGTTANPHGELTVMPGAAIRAIPAGATANYTTLAGMKAYPLGNCDPTGLAFGPGNDIAVNCREGTAGAPLLMEILDRTNGTLLASLNAGGGDQLTYAARTNRYYSAASRWTANGLSSGSSCVGADGSAKCTPRLIEVDAAQRAVKAMEKSGNNAHSVAFDPDTGKIFMPTSSNAKPAGCVDCGTMSAGLLEFLTLE